MDTNNTNHFRLEWDLLNWQQIGNNVFQLQHRIYIACKMKDLSSARNLQMLLLSSYEAKLYATHIVTTNQGRKTPGLDNWIALSDDDKYMVADTLALDGAANYIRRVYIPKPGTKDLRPLGIPTIIDRAKQCFLKLAIEPEFESKFEGNSFGFRPGRSAIDAVAKIRTHLIFNGPCYVLDTDIRKCFDRINHSKLIQRLCLPQNFTKQIDAWLRAGIFDKNEIIFPTEGTPQGGIISPLLANAAIDGFQAYMSEQVKAKFGFDIAKKTYYIRYADDLVCFAPTIDVISFIKEILAIWLSNMGLEMKEEATRIVNTLMVNPSMVPVSNSFDFLGFRFTQRYLSKHTKWNEGGKPRQIRTYVTVNPSRIQRHKASISNILRKIGTVKALIDQINPRISGWCNYFKHSDAKQYGDLPRKMDLWMNFKVRRWIRKTTKKRGKVPEFWKQDTKDWTLFYKDEEGKEINLTKYSSYQWAIYTYRAINTSFCPFAFDRYIDYLKWKEDRIPRLS